MIESGNPLISIIVPCYNQGHFLGEGLDSISTQSYTNWECIIVNDGSIDNTEALAALYVSRDERFKYIKIENSGLSAARNTGINNSTGIFIQFLDSDDLLEKDKLKALISFYLPANRNIATVVYSSMRYFEHDDPADLKILGRGDFIAHIELKETDSRKSQQELIKVRNPFVISAPLYPRHLFDTIGVFDENLRALEDWDLHIRCINSGFQFHHIYQAHTRTLIRLHNSSMMRNQQHLDANFYKLNLKHGLRNAEGIHKEPFSKRLVRGITPPALLDLFKRIFIL